MEPETALRDVFGLEDFRPGQRVVVDSVLSGKPTVAVMPTGAGKSLCFQLPAVCAGGTSLVVSPLIALMKDQVDALTARGVPACAITSALSPSEQAARLADVAQGRIRIAYVAPERFRSPRFEDALDAACSQARLSLLAVDEAHCISEWGHDFRPDYMRLGDAVARWRPTRLVALTATATPEVRRDIQKQLGIDDAAVFVRGFDRPNLRFSVEHIGAGAAKEQRLVTLVRGAAGSGPALVYAATRKNAETYAEELASAKLRARAYHAGLADDRRTATQDAFMNGDLDVVVATNAFGMGIDKTNVRLVVHADLPRSVEAYYQEAGRGGRDGEPAECVLLFNHADVKLQEFLIDAGAPSLDLLRALWRAVRSDPRRGADATALRRALPGAPSEAAVGSCIRFLLKAGYLREWEGVIEAVHPSDFPESVSPARLDTQALAARADVERQKLRAMVDYAYTSSCRRRFILAYFGDEDGARDSCGDEQRCDVCATVRAVPQGAERDRVHAALGLVARLDGRFGRKRVAELLTGEDDDARFLDLPGRGALERQGSRHTSTLLRTLEGAALIASSRGEYPTISITPLGRRVLGGHDVPLAVPSSPEKKARKNKRLGSEPPATPADPYLLDRLRAFRRELASREGVPAFCVFTDRTLDEIARARPPSLDALAGVYGFGAVKIAKYGPAILDLLRGAETSPSSCS